MRETATFSASAALGVLMGYGLDRDAGAEVILGLVRGNDQHQIVERTATDIRFRQDRLNKLIKERGWKPELY